MNKDKDHLKTKAVDLLVEMINASDVIQMYIEDEMEKYGFDFDTAEAITDDQANAWANAMSIVQMKFLAQVMEVL